MAIPASLPVSPSTVAAPAAHPTPVRSFGAVLEASASRSHLHAGPAPGTAPGAASVTGPGPGPGLADRALGALRSVEAAQARLDGLLAAARAGRTFTAQELLALQGEAYRFSQAMELATKLAEQGAQSVKQALHAQV